MEEGTRPKKAQIRWLPEHIAFVAASYPTHTVTELSVAFYKKFKLYVSPSAIGFVLWKRGVWKRGVQKIKKTPKGPKKRAAQR
jgi:hypothetical protein